MEEEDISPCALIYTSRVFAASGGGEVRFPGDNTGTSIYGARNFSVTTRERRKGRKGEESSPRVYQPGHYTSYVMSGSDSHIIPLYTWIDRFMSRVTERTRAFSSGARKRARAQRDGTKIDIGATHSLSSRSVHFRFTRAIYEKQECLAKE